MDDKTHELAVIKAQAKIRLEEIKAQDSAKEVAGKAIGEVTHSISATSIRKAMGVE